MRKEAQKAYKSEDSPQECPPLVLTYKLFVRAARDTPFSHPGSIGGDPMDLISKGGTLWVVVSRADDIVRKTSVL